MKHLRNLVLATLLILGLAIVPVAHAELLTWDPVETDCITVNIYTTLESSNNFQSYTSQPEAQNKNYVALDPLDFTKNVRYLFVATCTDGTNESGYSEQARYIFFEGGGGTSGPRSPRSFGIIDCSKVNNGQPWYNECQTENQATAD